MKKMTTAQLQQYIIVEAKKLMKAEMLKEEKMWIVGKLNRLNENEEGWTTATLSASEVGDFIDYLDGWNLQYESPVDLGNEQFSIHHEMETDDVMNKMNYQDAGERLSNMDDASNYSMDENENSFVTVQQLGVKAGNDAAKNYLNDKNNLNNFKNMNDREIIDFIESFKQGVGEYMTHLSSNMDLSSFDE